LASNTKTIKIILCKIIVPGLLYYHIFHFSVNLGFLTPTWDFFGAQSWDFAKTSVEALDLFVAKTRDINNAGAARFVYSMTQVGDY